MVNWTAFFEKVVIPVTGLLAFVYAAAGGPVPIALYPIVAGMIGLPVFRALDKIRQTNGDGKK